MAIAWSRISSKVIAHPPEADAARSRQCGNGTGRSGAVIPHMGDKRKREILGVRDVEMSPFSRFGRLGTCTFGCEKLTLSWLWVLGALTWPGRVEPEEEPHEYDQRQLVEKQMRHHGHA